MPSTVAASSAALHSHPMLARLARLFALFLVLVHAGLGAWAVIGLVELALSNVPWTRLSNPLFSSRMLLLQWALVLTAAATYIGGYVARWRRTPVALATVYAAMALTCAYQTFFILEHSSRFTAMVIEYVEYSVVLAFLLGSKTMRTHFNRNGTAGA